MPWYTHLLLRGKNIQIFPFIPKVILSTFVDCENVVKTKFMRTSTAFNIELYFAWKSCQSIRKLKQCRYPSCRIATNLTRLAQHRIAWKFGGALHTVLIWHVATITYSSISKNNCVKGNISTIYSSGWGSKAPPETWCDYLSLRYMYDNPKFVNILLFNRSYKKT